MGGIIPPALLEQIRAANDIVDVISAVVPLKRAGASFTALCPFHRERTPSFHVNPRKQTFHCFGCHKGGDVFSFIREYETLDFPEAVKRLAERARIPLEFEKGSEHQQQQFIKAKLFEIHEQITARWHHHLLNDAGAAKARDYLRERKVSDEAVKLFRLGCAPENWDDTLNWGKSKGFEPAHLELAGLLIRKEETGQLYSRFRGRLMFPICDDQGRVIGFSGRVLPGNDDPRKYVNSPETPLFIKSRVMFGLDKSKRAILDKQFAIVCEGQLDLISCFMAGVQNIVAPQGTAFTSEHARIIKRYASEVVLCFDSDEAGQKATVRVLDDLLGGGLSIRVAMIPAPHDPDSFIKNFGGPAFEELTKKAEGFFDYYLNRLCQLNDTATDKGRTAVLRAMAEAVQKTREPALFDTYAQRTAARLGLSPLAATRSFEQAVARPARRQSEEAAPETDDSWRPSDKEFWLLRFLLNHDETIDWARKHLHLDWIENERVRRILEKRLALDPAGHPVEPAAIHSLLQEDARAQSLLTEALVEDRPVPDPARQVADLVMFLRNQSIEKELAQIKRALESPGISEDETIQLLHERTSLQAAKLSPVTPINSP